MSSRLPLLIATLIISCALPQQAQEKYNIFIAGAQVTSANCNDLSRISGVSGTVNYTPETKTLTLENARIRAGERVAIVSYLKDLTVKVRGTNIVTSNGVAFSLTNSLTITGGGTLDVLSPQNSAIIAFGCDLTIDDCTVNAQGYWGISGDDNADTGERLFIKNAIVTAQGTEGSICDFVALTLEGCEVTEPAGARYEAPLKGIALNGEVVTSKVVIAKSGTGIKAPAVDEAIHKNDIYTIDGVHLFGELSEQPKGVYIVNGQKVVR